MKRFFAGLLLLLFSTTAFAADTKVSALTATTTASSDDVVYIVDDPGGTPLSRKITIANLFTSPTLVAPALGTPASGTLTNATGLPLAGVVDSTSEALGVGSLEVGHASDTTLSRSAAGILAVEGTAILKSSSGVAATPTASQTDTITHGLGRAPVIIRIYGGGTFTNSTSATPTTLSFGVYSSSGNTCMYQRYDPSAITGAEPFATSTAYSVRADTGVGNFVTGVIQNITSTQFDIAWTETGTATAQVLMWEAQ